MDYEKICLWFSSLREISARKINRILECFDDPAEIWIAPREEFIKIPELSGRDADTIIKNRDTAVLEAYLEKLKRLNISYITAQNEKYPKMLKEIHDPPAVLYYMGGLPEYFVPAVSIIGSRRCTEYGLAVSRKLASDLSSRGVVIVSGMAKGIDSSAHRGAIEGGGSTVAVLGCGADICYPSENRDLREQIIKNGCIMSEFPPGVKPLPVNFPIRNRIISGLSLAVAVVEAGEKSGTLITVNMALEQGREVLAVPGNITSKLSQGVNSLIKQGAGVLVSGYRDVLDAIGYEEKTPANADNIESGKKLDLAPDEKLVYDCVGFEPVTVETIASGAGIGISEATYLVTMLEIKGALKKLPGQRFVRN